jgi:hypothetical protein
MSKTSLGALSAVALMAGTMTASAAGVRSDCSEEWTAAKTAGMTNGQSWSDFYKACRAGKETAAATPEPTPVAQAAPAPSPTPAPKPSAAAKKTPVVATGAGEFANEAEAKAHCPADTVVWVNTKSHKYHYSGNRSYGTTKRGAYMCEADAKAAKDVAAKDEKPR